MMAAKEFEQEYRGTFPEPDAHYRAACVLWCRYYLACDGYDRRVCAARTSYGGAVPLSPEERRHVQEKAARVLGELQATFAWRGIPKETVESAKRVVLEMSEEQRALLLERGET